MVGALCYSYLHLFPKALPVPPPLTPYPAMGKNSEAEISVQEFIREHYLCRTGKQVGAEGEVQLQFTCSRVSADPARHYGAAMALQSPPPFVRSLSGQNQCITETFSSRSLGCRRSEVPQFCWHL